MSDDDSPGGELRGDLLQPQTHELVREAMEAVAANARLGQLSRQCKHLREQSLSAVECRVEASNLGNMRSRCCDRLNRRDVMRLMEWRERTQALERRDCLSSNQRGRREMST